MNDKYQKFLSRLQNASEAERDWMVMEFNLQNLSDTLRQAVWAAAIPHWFDAEFLNAILAQPLKDRDFKVLTELSFIETFPGRGFNVHERSRKLLLERLWINNKHRYHKLCNRAAAYAKKQDQNDTVWRVETLYHCLLANKPSAKGSFIEQGLTWLNSFAFDKVESLTRMVLEAADCGQLAAETAAWGYFFQAEVDNRYGRYSSAQALLYQALSLNNSGLLAAHCWSSLGDTNKYLTEYSQAQDCYRRALRIYQRINNRLCEANCIRSFGDVHHLLSEYSHAQDCYQQALPIYRLIKSPLGEANCLQSLGNVHASLGEYLQARNYIQQALPIYQQIKERIGEANCIRAFGNIHRALAEYLQAQDCYQQALLIYRQIQERVGEAHCIRSLGDIHQAMAEYSKAQDCYQQAMTIYQQIKYRAGEVLCIKGLGELYGAKHDTKSAVANLKQAAEIYAEIGNKHGQAWCSNDLAVIYQRQQQFSFALATFGEALEIYPGGSGFYRNRAALYLQMDDYPNATADIQQAEKLGGDSAYILLCKAELALWQQQVPQAVEFCRQALALRPADGSFRAMLALCLLTDRQVFLAQSEMTQALGMIYQRYDVEELLRNLNKLVKIYGHISEVDTVLVQILNHPALKNINA